MKLLVHGSGFRRPYRNDPEELRCGKPKELRGNPDCNWFPSSARLGLARPIIRRQHTGWDNRRSIGSYTRTVIRFH